MTSPDCKINERVFERLACAAARSVPGVMNQDAKLAGIAGRSLPRFTAFVDRHAGVVNFDGEVALAFPAPAKKVVAKVRETISTRIQQLTGYRVGRLNISVSAFQATPASRVAPEQVAQYVSSLRLSPVSAPQCSVRSPKVKPAKSLRSVDIVPRFTGYVAPTPQTPTPVPLRPVSAPQPGSLSPITIVPFGGAQ